MIEVVVSSNIVKAWLLGIGASLTGAIVTLTVALLLSPLLSSTMKENESLP